jgi:hypothetical protein
MVAEPLAYPSIVEFGLNTHVLAFLFVLRAKDLEFGRLQRTAECQMRLLRYRAAETNLSASAAYGRFEGIVFAAGVVTDAIGRQNDKFEEDCRLPPGMRFWLLE